jgi:hypothetical protein
VRQLQKFFKSLLRTGDTHKHILTCIYKCIHTYAFIHAHTHKHIHTSSSSSPRVTLSLSPPLTPLISFSTDHRYSRVPVYRGDVDHIVGVVYSKDLLEVRNVPCLYCFYSSLLHFDNLVNSSSRLVFYYIPHSSFLPSLILTFPPSFLAPTSLLSHYPPYFLPSLTNFLFPPSLHLSSLYLLPSLPSLLSLLFPPNSLLSLSLPSSFPFSPPPSLPPFISPSYLKLLLSAH